MDGITLIISDSSKVRQLTDGFGEQCERYKLGKDFGVPKYILLRSGRHQNI